MANKYERQTLKEKNSDKEIYPNIISDCIPENAIDTSHIKKDAITTEKIADGAVTDEKISGTFGKDRIADNSISTEKIQINAVTTEKIADGAVTVSKISNITQGNTVATKEYVDEHGGGGGGTTLYKHHIKITMLDQCGNLNFYGIIILQNNQEQSYTFDTFKNLFTAPMDPFQAYTEYGMCLINVPASQYFSDEYQYAPKVTYFYYSPEEDFYDCDDSYSGHLTLQNVVDTVTPV